MTDTIGRRYEDNSNGPSFFPYSSVIPGHNLADREIPGSKLYPIIIGVGNRYLWKELSHYIEVYL